MIENEGIIKCITDTEHSPEIIANTELNPNIITNTEPSPEIIVNTELNPNIITNTEPIINPISVYRNDINFAKPNSTDTRNKVRAILRKRFGKFFYINIIFICNKNII